MLTATAFFVLACALDTIAAEPKQDANEAKPDFKKVDFKFIIKKKTKKDFARSYYDDNKLEVLYFYPKLTSRLKVAIKDYKLLVYIIGQSVDNKKVFSLLEIATYDLNIPMGKKTFEPKERTFSTRYDKENEWRGSDRGFKYYSYIIVAKDPSGAIVYKRSSKSLFNKILDPIFKYKKGTVFDNKGQEIKRYP